MFHYVVYGQEAEYLGEAVSLAAARDIAEEAIQLGGFVEAFIAQVTGDSERVVETITE